MTCISRAARDLTATAISIQKFVVFEALLQVHAHHVRSEHYFRRGRRRGSGTQRFH
jgi:hypothetical protein